MSLRKVANDLWVVEKASKNKFSYVGMIRLIEGEYRAIMDGKILGAGRNLEEAEKFYD